jgi:hypothetical protein
MKPLRLAELLDLVASRDFLRWRDEHATALAARDAALARAEALDAAASAADSDAERVGSRAVEALAEVGAIEDDAARLAAEGEAVENASLEAVAAYEAQRERTSALWLRLGGAERATDARRDRVALVRTRVAAQPAPELAVELADEEGLLARAGSAELSLDGEYRRESARKVALWAEVEALWGKSLAIALLVAERGTEARRRHRDAERLFADAEERKQRARAALAERDRARRDLELARAAVGRALDAARARFDCVCGERFLYFARAGTKEAFAIALADDAESHGAPVRALGVYAVGRERGVAQVAPAEESP